MPQLLEELADAAADACERAARITAEERREAVAHRFSVLIRLVVRR